MRPTYTPAQAAAELDRLALEAEDENYHTVASLLWDIMPHMELVKERTLVILPLEFGGIVQFYIDPDHTPED